MPPDSNKPVRPAARVQQRTLGAVRRVEDFDTGNTNRTLSPDRRDQRGDRHVFPVKVTDQPSLGDPYLWPAVVRYWSGYAAGTHSFDDYPDAEVADIWAFVMPTSAGLETDGEYLGVFVGIHTDGLAVFEVVPPGASLVTGNVGDSGAQDSTTTVLRFDEATKIKVTKGATAGDPDIVSMDGLDATTSGLTVPGTTVAGVVTATRDLPALPRAWAKFSVTAGTPSLVTWGGIQPTAVSRPVAGSFVITWPGVSANWVVLAQGNSIPAVYTATAVAATDQAAADFTDIAGTYTDPQLFDVVVIG